MQKYGKTLKDGRIFPIFYNFAVKINEIMRYYEVKFSISAPEALFQDVCDVLAAMAGEAGFETFEQTPAGLTGYIQQEAFNDERIQLLLSQMPFDDIQISFNIAEAEDRDWNEQWEQEGFEPVSVGEHLIIHDGRHVPHPAPDQLLIEIDAKLAFGTGNHQTTRLMADALMALPLSNCTILDCGTGTGILAILALLQGAQSAVGYDIDEWSVDNARHNAVLNGVDDRFSSILGDSAVISNLPYPFDVVTANINRNILLADLPRFRQAMKPRATLLLSGFYTEDIPLLSAKAAELGFALISNRQEAEWACLEFKLTD